MPTVEERPPAWSLLPAVAILSAPIAVLLAGLWLFGGLAPGKAAIALFLAAAANWLLARWHFSALTALISYAWGLRRDVPPSPPPGAELPIVADLRRAIDELHREHAEAQGRLAAGATAATAILDTLPDPVLMLDATRRVVQANAAAAKLFGGNLLGRDLALVLRHPAVLEAVAAVLSKAAPAREAPFVLSGPVSRDLVARVVALPHAAGADTAALLTLQDVTSVKRAEQMRVDFVANASHELRTPLSTLIGFIETLQGPAKDDAAARVRFLAIMREQAERMSRLIRDLLSLSQIELNEHTVPEDAVDLLGVLRGVADTLQLQLAGKQMRIDIAAPASLPAVLGDRDQLIQVFQNLLDNALKYGRPGSAVEVAIDVQPAAATGAQPGRQVAVAVRDHGEGIAREHLPRLTERFYRVDHARSRELGGTGLGLAIVKHIVNRHRGSLHIDSVEGEGSSFTVTLPAGEMAPATGPKAGPGPA